MSQPIIVAVAPLGFPWATVDPFLFCAHHEDFYPAGDERMAPTVSLAGRNLGMDFEIRDGFRMYHGEVVPGFPRHPHRGFETVTLARRGFIDHSDSMGATARFGHGDVQWMTAGRGVVHAEMFPLVNRDAPNPTELFQIWLNLPRADKLVEPHFAMLWSDTIPRHALDGVTVTTIAGTLGDGPAPPPPAPKSWAARPEADVAIWTIELAPGARWTIPPGRPGSSRVLYFFRGDHLTVADRALSSHAAVQVRPDAAVPIENGDAPAELLMLQGQPLGEPVAQHGPFVMNTPGEIRQAFADYQRTGFGGWPWEADDPVHPREQRRFAKHADGRVEQID